MLPLRQVVSHREKRVQGSLGNVWKGWEWHMVKIAILNDEPDIADKIASLLVQCAKRHAEQFQVGRYQLVRELLWDLDDRKLYYDIYVLDIELDGFKVAQHIRELYLEPFIVFVSSYVKYSVQGYRYNACRYILKPDLETEFSDAMDYICDQIANTQECAYVIESASHMEKLYYKDIYYLYVDGKYTYFVTRNGISKVRKTLGKVFSELDAPEFVYLDKSNIVNLKHVMSIKKLEVSLRDGTMLTVSRTKIKQLKKSIREYWGM